MIDVHAQAVIHPSAKLGEGVRIGPYAVIGEHCSLGDGTVVGAHAVIEPYTTIGRDCQIFPHAVIGGVPQDLKFVGEESYTILGDRNVIREFATIHRATGVGQETRLGNDNLIMSTVHVAHNCQIGNHVIVSSGTSLAGHVEVDDYAVVAGMSGVHQFVRIGTMAMVGALSKLVQDLPPYLLCEGNPPVVHGPNSVNLKRRQVPSNVRLEIKRAFKLLYRSNLNLSQALKELQALEAFPEIQHLIHFVETSERGILGITTRHCLEGKD